MMVRGLMSRCILMEVMTKEHSIDLLCAEAIETMVGSAHIIQHHYGVAL